LRAGKGNNYEGGVRVPLIVRVPGVTKAGKKSKVITSTVDHYASLLELLDIPFPQDVVTDGVSYVKALKGKNYERSPIYSTFCHNVVATGNRANISMRQGPWRLYKFYYDGSNQEHRYELYNLDDDIGETKNLAAEMPEKVVAMTKLLDAHVDEAGILLPQKNANYAGNVADAWVGSDDTHISVSKKTLKIESMGKTPSVESFFTPNIGGCSLCLKFELKSNSEGNGNVSWIEGNRDKYSKEKTVAFSVVHDNNWHAYKVALPIDGRLTRIKIQPSTNKGNINLKNIELVDTEGYFIRDWPLY
jgi:hypothetical protein